MPSIEADVKKDFVLIFTVQDAALFKEMAECYFRQAVFLQKADVKICERLRLLGRNCQKRLFLGIGTELLLKAIYLKYGHSINELENAKEAGAPKFPFNFQQVGAFKQAGDRTFTMACLIDHLGDVVQSRVSADTARGLKIAKVFRNKEGHVILPKHTPRDANYRDIERALGALYQQAFNQDLNIRISFRPNEKGVWHLA